MNFLKAVFNSSLFCRNIIIELLETLPQMFRETARAESVYTSAVRGGLQALVSVFFSCGTNFFEWHR